MLGQWSLDYTLQEDASKFKKQVLLVMGLVFLQAVCQVLNSFFMNLIKQATIKRVHNDLVDRIMNAPINLFFDVTSNGAIMKRFNEDVGYIEHVIHSLIHHIHMTGNIFTIIYLTSSANLYILILYPLLAAWTVYIYQFTIGSYREIHRLLHRLGQSISNN